MKLFNMMMPAQLRERLDAEKKRSGFTVSEITRRALDQYLEEREAGHGDGHNHGQRDVANRG